MHPFLRKMNLHVFPGYTSASLLSIFPFTQKIQTSLYDIFVGELRAAQQKVLVKMLTAC